MKNLRTTGYKGKRAFQLASFVLLMITLLMVEACWAERYAPIEIQNNTNQSLSVSAKFKDSTYFIGDVAPGATIKNKNPKILYFSRFLIEARNSEKEIVFSQEFTFDEMVKRDWKVIILTSQK